MTLGQRVQQAGFANIRSATKSDFRSLISGKIIRSCCALDESGGTDLHYSLSRGRKHPHYTKATPLVHDGFLKIAVTVYGWPERNFIPLPDQRRRRVSQCYLQNLVHIFNKVDGKLILNSCRNIG